MLDAMQMRERKRYMLSNIDERNGVPKEDSTLNCASSSGEVRVSFVCKSGNNWRRGVIYFSELYILPEAT